MPTRIALRCVGSTYGMKAALPATMSELLDLATSKLGLTSPARRIFAEDGDEYDDIGLIGKDEVLYVSCGEDYAPPAAVPQPMELTHTLNSEPQMNAPMQGEGERTSEEEEPTTIDSLPLELIERILVAVSDPPGDGYQVSRRLSSYQSLNSACTSSRRLFEAGKHSWQHLAKNVVEPHCLPPSTDWFGELPHSWSACLAGAVTLRAPRLRAFGAPVPRHTYGHSACAWQGQLFLFGGRHDLTHSQQLDVLDLSRRQWSATSTRGETPSPRRFHSATVDPATGMMYVVGGGLGTDGKDDLHALDLATLESASQNRTGGPPSRQNLYSSL